MKFSYEIYENSDPIESGEISFYTMEEQVEWLKQAYVGHYRSVTLQPTGLESVADPVEAQLEREAKELMAEYSFPQVAYRCAEKGLLISNIQRVLDNPDNDEIDLAYTQICHLMRAYQSK